MNVAEVEGLAMGARLMNGMDEAEAIAYLARRVIAAEKLVDNAEWVLGQFRDQFEDCSEADAIDGLESALAAYEATK